MTATITQEGIELRSTPGKGEGIFATRRFEAGEVVVVGTVEKVLPGNSVHAAQVDVDTYVLHSGLMPMVNHSCDPTCGIKIDESYTQRFIALRQILPNEEISFDYSTANYNIENFGETCMCGAEACRSTIKGWKDLSDEVREELKVKRSGLIAPYFDKLD